MLRSTAWAGLIVGGLILLPLATACGSEERGGQPAEAATMAPTELPSATPNVTAPPTATPLSPNTSTPGQSTRSDTPSGHPDIAPPLAVLTSQVGIQEAALGTYCWQEGDQGLCVDFVGIQVPDAVLTVEEREPLTVRVPGIDQLVNVAVDVYDFSHAEISRGQRQILYPLPERITIPFQNNGPSVTLTAELPPGQYVISMFVGFPATPLESAAPNATASPVRGDAVYGFHIEVIARSD